MACKPLYCVCGKWVIPQRYILCFMAFFAILISYAMRVCLHLAITEIVIPRPPQNTTSGHSICPGNLSEEVPVRGGTYNWTESQQGWILSMFFPGYVLTHLPGGLMADKYGARHIISAGVALSGACTLVTPLAIKVGGWWLLMCVRIVMGFVQGPLYPCVSTLLARWIPVRERSGLGAFVNAGNQIGSIAGNLFTSMLMTAVDWQIVFYFWGVIAAVWYVLFLLLCYSTPSDHPHITPEEAELLATEIGPPQKMDIPWKGILTDPVTWALLAGELGHDWIFLLIVVQLPKYMKDVLKFNIKENGVMNALPYLCLWICSVISGIIADCIIDRGWATTLRIRQIYTFVGNVGPGACVIIASLLGCDRIAASSMFILGMFIMGPFYPGLKVNVLDVTRNFAGIIMAIVNGVASMLFTPVPAIIGYVAVNNSLEEWRIVFVGLFIACILTSIWYVIFTSTERRKWDYPKE